VDLDLGEIFLNFSAPEWIRPYFGIRIDAIAKELDTMPEQQQIVILFAWTRLLMGFKTSPSFVIKSYHDSIG